jgi:hypothetical protein
MNRQICIKLGKSVNGALVQIINRNGANCYFYTFADNWLTLKMHCTIIYFEI